VRPQGHPDPPGGLPYRVALRQRQELGWPGGPGRGREWGRLVGALGSTGATVRTLQRGAVLPAFGGRVVVLHPPADWRIPALNETSLTLRLTHGVTSVLLTGDIEAEAERSLIASAPDALPADVLKGPHHGSRSSSTAPFVAAVRPRVAVISVGADNRSRLPAPDVEARYRAHGVCVLRTDRCGAVTLVSDGRRLDLTTVRPGCACS